MNQNQYQNKSHYQNERQCQNKHQYPYNSQCQNDNHSSNSQTVPCTVETLEDAHGAVPYGMTNDYMFRAVLQSNNKVLRGLVCSLLHLSEQDIASVQISNPIVLGDAVNDKEFRLDINVLLNDSTLINLEMQVANRMNWEKRSVLYLCRSLDNLNRGQDYDEVMPAIHIGFLDYSLSDESPEFYATYKLLNVKNYQIYSDILTLSVVDLSHIDLATKDDKKYHIDYWAALFKAATWEELKMLAAKNEYLNEAAKTVFQMNADDIIRKRCLDREEYYKDLRSYEKAVKERDDIIAERDNTIAAQDNTIAAQNNAIAERDNTIAAQDNAIAEQKTLIRQLHAEIERLRQKKSE